jgi:hypothetical protein
MKELQDVVSPKRLDDKELQERLQWSEEDVKALDDIVQGRATRGAFARIAGLKLKLEAAHHGLVKDAPQSAAPVTIVLVGMEEARPPKLVQGESVKELTQGSPRAVPEDVTAHSSDDPALSDSEDREGGSLG